MALKTKKGSNGAKTEFHRTNLEKFQEHAKRALEGEKERETIELVEGLNVLRVMPPWSAKADGNPFREIVQHSINNDAISALTGRKRPEKAQFSLVCRQAELEEECPVCEYIDELMSKSKRSLIKLARTLSPQSRTYCNAILVSYRRVGENEARRGSGDVKVWGFGGGIRKALYGFMTGSDPELGDEPIDFTHPQTGRNIIVKRTGEGIATRYPEIKLGTKPMALPSMSLLKKMRDLDSFVAEFTPEYDEARDALNESAAMMLGGGGAVDSLNEDDLGIVLDDSEDVQKPKKKLKLKRS